MMELCFDSGDIGKDIGMIVFEIVQNGRFWPIVDELASFIKEGRVVFVGLNEQKRGFLFTMQSCRDTEIQWNATNQKTWGNIRHLPISMPAWEVVVVLPCVPATPRTHLSFKICSPIHCGPET